MTYSEPQPFTINKPAKTDDDYLRSVCVHECAHAAACRKVGGYGLPEVWPNQDGIVENKPWAGHCAYPGVVRDRDLRLIGLAGSVAEMIFVEKMDEGDVIIDFYNGEVELSDTDAKMAAKFTERDVKKCVKLIIEMRQEILQEAELLFASAKAYYIDEDLEGVMK